MTGQSAADLAAQDALRARQGKGARYDAANAPKQDLLHARRGTAALLRRLNSMTDAELSQPSCLPGWTRSRLIADVSYQARTIAIALKSVRETLTTEEATWEPDVALAETLPARALRHLFSHSAVHLDVEFRDLDSSDWDKTILVPREGPFPIRNLPSLRAQAVWNCAKNLGSGQEGQKTPVAPVLVNKQG